jgi:multidrug efflux pump subunit AcrB
LIGVLFGLLIFRSQLNFAAFIGLVSLTGIVVNNAIILVDRMNADRRAGKSTLEAVREAAESRLRPIILTTVTTAAGVAPLIWVDEFFRDMAVTLITGLLFSSILTLVLIPVLYLRQQQKLERKRLKKNNQELASESI